MIAIWPAGPPKLMKPSASQNRVAWRRLGAGGAAVALVALWLSPILVYAGLLTIVAGNVADFLRGRRRNAQAA